MVLASSWLGLQWGHLGANLVVLKAVVNERISRPVVLNRLQRLLHFAVVEYTTQLARHLCLAHQHRWLHLFGVEPAVNGFKELHRASWCSKEVINRH